MRSDRHHGDRSSPRHTQRPRRAHALCGDARVRATAAVVVGSVVGAALAGCGAATAPLPADAPLATYEWDGGDRMQAGLEGTLTLENGCVYVVSPDGHRTLPVFPADRVGWDARTETLTYGGSDYAMGDEIAAGGGWVAPGASASLPEQCEPDEWGDVMLVQDDTLETMAERGY